MNGSCNCKHFHFLISPPSYINSIEDDSWDKLEDCPIFPEQHANIERTSAEEEIAADDNQVLQKPRGMPEPILPSPAEVNLHNLSHIPYRSWCQHCVAARRNAQAHASQAKSPQRMLPLIVFDYCFVKGASDETLATVLVARLYPSRALFACVCDNKGPDECATFRLSLFLKENGYQKFVYKSDQ